jgi:hypothetical protein
MIRSERGGEGKRGDIGGPCMMSVWEERKLITQQDNTHTFLLWLRAHFL